MSKKFLAPPVKGERASLLARGLFSKKGEASLAAGGCFQKCQLAGEGAIAF